MIPANRTGSIMLDAGKDELRADDRGDRTAQAVERLCQVQPLFGARRIAERDDVRIGSGLEEGRARGEDEQRRKERGIFANLRRRIEEQRAEGI